MSSNGSDFNYDFHVTLDEKVAPVEYNFQSKEDFDESKLKYNASGEQPGVSVFKLEDGQVFHTYSTYARLEGLAGTYNLLDLTPAGRQEGPNGPAGFKTPAEYEKEEIGE